MINWSTPSPAQIPASLAKCGQEKLFADEHAEILVDKYCTTFHPYQGEEQIYTYGNKAIVVDQGKPTYAEFAALSLFRSDTSITVGNYQPVGMFPKRISFSPHSLCLNTTTL